MRTLNTVSVDYSALLTLDEAKKWLRVEGNDEDLLITQLLNASVAYAENYLGKTVGSNVYIQSQDTFEERMKLFRPPVGSIEKIEYVDPDGDIQEVAAATYKLNKDEGIVYLAAGKTFPQIACEPFAVKIYYTCTGLHQGNAAQDIEDAILMILTYRYDYRDDPNQRWRKASDSILNPLRIQNF